MFGLTLKRAIRSALAKPAPDRIPRTLPKAKSVNCFVVQIGQDQGAPFFLGKTYQKEGVEGLWWDGNSYDVPFCMSFKEIDASPLEITHYFGPYEFTSYNPLGFIVKNLFLWPRIYVAVDKLRQFFFNKKKLIRGDRIKVLQVILSESIQKRGYSVSSVKLMGLLYSNRWVFHPEKDALLRYNRYLLDSLASSGDLAEDNGSYSITGQALTTITSYEEDQRRHRDQFAIQVLISILTFCLVVVGGLQAYGSFIK